MVDAEATMNDEDESRFQLGDPLNRWSLIFLAAGIAASIWLVALFAIMAADLTAVRDKLILNENQWVVLITILLIASIVGLIFVIVGRVGGTQGGSYLSADLDAEERARNEAAAEEVADDEYGVDTLVEDPTDRLLRGARVVDPFGADGKVLLSYTVPVEAGAGVYGDVMIAVDTDAKLNVRTRLAPIKPKA